MALLLPLLSSGLIVAGPAPLARRTFSGTIYYQPEAGDWRSMSGVSVHLWGNVSRLGWVLLDTAITGRDGSFGLATDTLALGYRVVKDDPRGFTPRSAYGGAGGSTVDPNTLAYGSSVEFASGLHFVVADPVPPLSFVRGHYLIVTSQAIVASGALDAFMAYKTSLGLAMHVVTVEELDPTSLGGNLLRSRIRQHEQSMRAEQGLDYVLLIGTHDVVPFMTYNPGGPDLSRYDPNNPAFLSGGYPEACSGFSREPNNCGWAGDWFYVDLTSNWDTNGDGIYGEAIWAGPDALQDWFDAGVLPNNAGPGQPAGYTPDQPPAFQVDVSLGRLMIDAPETVRKVLRNIIEFEQDGGEWKSRTLLAGAMMALGGRAWDPAHSYPNGRWVDLPESTDTGYMMERAWSDILAPAGFQRVTLYEQQSASGGPPSGLVPTAPLSHANLVSQWTAQPAGLVKLAGHGSPDAVVRVFWDDDTNGDGQIQNPTRPWKEWEPSEYEIAEVAYVVRTDALNMPASKRPVLMAMACSTGFWADPSNLGTNLLSRGKVSAWIGGTSTVNYRPGWQQPDDGSGQTIDYLITEGIFAQQLPLGDAVWQGLARAYVQQDGASWGAGKWDLGFVNYDLYGDPSMRYWGNAASRTPAWPMQGYDWAGSGETALLGPAPASGSGVAMAWQHPLASIADTQRVSSPVVGRDSDVIIGDASGAVRRLAYGSEVWRYQTGGAIVNAAALASDGTVYVKAENGTLYALNWGGTLRWSRQVGQGEGSPRLGANGLVYVGGSEPDGSGGTRFLLLAYDANGHRVGSGTLDARATSSAVIDAEDRVYVGTANGRVYRFSADLTGPAYRTLTTGHAIGNGLAIPPLSSAVLVPSTSGQLYQLKMANLTTDWSVNLGSPLRGAPAATTDGRVYVGTADGRLVAYATDTGDLLWSTHLGGAIEGAPALDPINLFVVAGAPAEVVALKRATGEVVWRMPLGGSPALASSPAIGPGRQLYVAGRTASDSPGAALFCVALDQWLRSPDILNVDPRPKEIIIDIRVYDPLSLVRIESRMPGGNWGLEATLDPGVTRFVDTIFGAGQPIEYRAQALPAAMALRAGPTELVATEPSEYSPSVRVTALPDVPTIPPAPAVETVSAHGLRLTWAAEDPVSEAVHVLRRGPGESVYQEVVALAAGVRSYVDSGLLPQSTYSYQLQVSNAAGQSAVSGASQGTTRNNTLAPPSHVAAEAVGGAAFALRWTPSSVSYRTVVARQPLGQAAPEILAEMGPGVAAYTDHVAAPYAFAYWVKHVDSTGTNESPWVRTAPLPAQGFLDMLPLPGVFLPLIRRG